jgi:hypothetical protein
MTFFVNSRQNLIGIGERNVAIFIGEESCGEGSSPKKNQHPSQYNTKWNRSNTSLDISLDEECYGQKIPAAQGPMEMSKKN